ncbi:ribosome biogenesis/translation initiation ATPase RLI [Candidatus Pacearchaeota archaeon CG_4_10_14_0_2_um_filter_31_10]|nr:MAG: ribosome biogenesis/translation initiation ATPase RLI [Candidatus Pacearchaeota archaeon CG_4_10_14_0_2_um_filter_31_10]
MKIAIVHKEKCNPESCGKLCSKLCPVNRKGEDCIIIEKKASISEELCIGCAICQNRCPFNAISIINLPEKLDKDLIYRFGKNGFALYRLPLLRFGSILGLFGKNGIGKSTTLKIFSGHLKINFGREKAEEKEIKEYFKGSELLNYFENIDKIKISYKPQNLSELGNSKVKVSDVISQIQKDKKKIGKIVSELNIENFLDRQLNQLSGGELQKVSIAIAFLKDADVYFIDEPLAYLDIEERIRISNFIRKIVSEKKAVIVVEHDLLMLDFLTDYINIFYGNPSDYGVVSTVMTSKTAVNTYLGGFLKEDNIRFRDKPIKFFKIEQKQKSNFKLFDWPNFTKTFKNFKLNVNSSFINEGSVTGIIGKNGIGKTTFVKCLANEIDIDKGKIDSKKMRFAYKPQYLNSNSDDLVAAIIKKEKIDKYLIHLFSLEMLNIKKIKELSGGELQRLEVARCLSKDADLYLIDEPSAYLDVEERLNVAKAINEIIANKSKACFVVDHDLLFLSYVADSLLVFSGEAGKNGETSKSLDFSEGLNRLLKELNITVRRDEETLRPRINKPDSVLDRKQKEKGKYFED